MRDLVLAPFRRSCTASRTSWECTHRRIPSPQHRNCAVRKNLVINPHMHPCMHPCMHPLSRPCLCRADAGGLAAPAFASGGLVSICLFDGSRNPPRRRPRTTFWAGGATCKAAPSCFPANKIRKFVNLAKDMLFYRDAYFSTP